jgi:hypothetical protein
MSGLWSAEQQAWLMALGHRVLVLAGDEAVVPFAEDLMPGRTAEPMPSAEVRGATAKPRPGPGPDTTLPPVTAVDRARAEGAPERRPAPPRAPLEADIAMAPSSRAAIPRAPDDALERALLRVTGQRTRSEARAVLERLGVDVQALRGNPAAKRALWRQLRPLQPRFRP